MTTTTTKIVPVYGFSISAISNTKKRLYGFWLLTIVAGQILFAPIKRNNCDQTKTDKRDDSKAQTSQHKRIEGSCGGEKDRTRNETYTLKVLLTRIDFIIISVNVQF